jgi:O-antigen ligase
MVGYSTASYLAFVIAILLARYLKQARSESELPGTLWLLCLAVLVFLQFFRSASMRDSFPVLCDILSFTVVIWCFPRISRTDLQRAGSAFIIGTVGAGLAFLFVSPISAYRLGFELGFNPNELGYVIGAALLLLASGSVVRKEHFAFWWMVTALSVLLVLTQSRTSIYACFGAIVLFLFLRRKRLLAASLALAAVALLSVGYVRQVDDPFSLTGRLASPISESFDESSAQRARIWGFLLTQVGSYWKWGAGLRNVSEITAEAGIGVIGPAGNVSIGYQSHNLYLTTLLELGVLGLCFLLAWQFGILYRGLRQSDSSALLIPMMLYVMIQGFFGGFFGGYNLNFLSAFLLVAAYRVQSKLEITHC